MNRRNRLTRAKDFERVRRLGKSYAHPLIVWIGVRTDEAQTRFGVAAGRSMGGAVQRNRAKRRLRAALEPIREQVAPGWDVILIARPPLLQADFSKVEDGLRSLARKAGLLPDD